MSDPRIVSLVPSLTQTLWDLGVGAWVVGVTRFCTHPPQAREQAAIIGGTKDPDVEAVIGLRPDLVLADVDENRAPDLDRLRQAKVRVHVTRIHTVADAAGCIVDIGRILGRGVQAQGLQQEIQETVAACRDAVASVGRLRVFVPIWRKPLMTAGGPTYLSDLLRIAGADNVFAHASRSYFETDFDEVRAQEPQVALLPSEPYRFGTSHRPEFAQALGLDEDAVECIDGRALTWFGSHAAAGLDSIARSVGVVRARLAEPAPHA